MIRTLYTLILALASPFLLYGLYKKKPGKPSVGQRWVEHFGFSPTSSQSKPLWIHAVSVGEVIAAKPIIKALREQYPSVPLLITTTTSTGAEQAMQLGEGIEHRYMPIDFSWTVRGFLKRIQPRALLIMETELWPNTLATVKQAGLPITVLNARLSERSKQRYQQFQTVFDLLSNNLDQVICQYKEDADRFMALGIEQNKVSIAGSVKFDITVNAAITTAASELKTSFNQRPVWIAASTHSGEDEIILRAHQQVLAQAPDALLVLVPRHPERFDSVADLISQQFTVSRRHHSEAVTAQTQVYLGDTMGEMMLLFACADVAFMGGSLLGDKVGGHNMLEPAALAKPILTGPSFYNFQIITEQLMAQQACAICHNDQEIAEHVIRLMKQPALQQQQGSAALAVVQQNQGAVQRTLEQIAPYLGEYSQ
ncbi:lipid IV(A) 3-deoxy-D-manno-octulosonic acid transferase [Photobacterium swingsii]|uniref:lipid IV(A) 3-deoxy-D-manno-octulosonic acid transferase n=1 Tax=Photobacterium swingsii TaxID=680026 RepID=UPI00354CA3D7